MTIEEMEAEFPTLSGIAFSTARREALAAGHSVMGAKDGVLYEEFPDGRRVEIKKIEPPFSIPVGTKLVAQ